MAKHTLKLRCLTSLTLLVTSFLAACTSTALPTLTTTASTPALAPTTTRTPTPSLIPTITHTAIPTRTPTPTYLPITPVLQGTRLPESGGVISASNAERLMTLARWGLGNPNDIVYTPDGEYLIVACARGVYFYDPVNYLLVRQIDTTYLPWHLAVSPDSQMLAVAGPEQVYLYQISDLQLWRTFPTQANSLDFSPDGQVLLMGTITEIQLRHVHSGEILGKFVSEMGVLAVKFSPQGGFIASGGYNTKVWSLDGTLTAEQGPRGFDDLTVSVSFSPDGSLLAESSRHEIHIWQLLENGHLTHFRQIDLTNFDYTSIYEVVFSPEGSMVAAALASGIYAWNLETGYRVFSAEIDGAISITSLAWSMDSQHITAASPENGVQVWDVSSVKNIASLHSQSGNFTSLAWSPDSQVLAAGADEGWAYLFNTHNGDLLQRLGSGYLLNSLAFAPDGQSLALGYERYWVDVWNFDGFLEHTLDNSGYSSIKVRFSANGDFLSTIGLADLSVAQVRVWNTRDWSAASTLSTGTMESHWIVSFDLAPDQQFAAISRSGYNNPDLINIVTVPDGALVTSIEVPGSNDWGTRSTAFSPSGNMFAVYSSTNNDVYRVHVWRTSDWELLYTTHSVIPSQRQSIWHSHYTPYSLAWSPDGTLLAVSVSDGGFQILNAITGDGLVTLPAHRMGVAGVAFSPDGRLLASCSIDGTIMLWGTR